MFSVSYIGSHSESQIAEKTNIGAGSAKHVPEPKPVSTRNYIIGVFYVPALA